MTDYAISELDNESGLPMHSEYNPFNQIVVLNGYLSSTYPEYITSVEGVPTSAKLIIVLRTGSDNRGNGTVVATTRSGADGTWRIDGLNPSFKYDVICRAEGYNDLIFSNITPLV